MKRSLTQKFFFILLVVIFELTLSPFLFAGTSTKLIKIGTRPGVKQKFMLIKSDNPTAAVILLDGGTGMLKLSSTFGKVYIGKSKIGFLVRNRDFFARQKLMVALVDAPSDMKKLVCIGRIVKLQRT